MLNELATLRSSLVRHKIEIGDVHPWVKRKGRALALVAGLDAGGLVRTAEFLTPDEAALLPNIQPDNHHSFPGINVTPPVWQVDASAKETLAGLAGGDLGDRLRAMQAACEKARLSDKAVKALRSVTSDAKMLQTRFRSPEPMFAAFDAVLERAAKLGDGEEAWYRSLTEAVLRAAEEAGEKAVEFAEALLVGRGDKAGKKAAVIVDVADYACFPCRVADQRMAGYFSRQLLSTEAAEGEEGTCSLTGAKTVIQTEPFPRPILPVLGQTSLMSMNPDTPCQTRYGRIGTEVFRTGRQVLKDLNSALIAITAADREYKTWQRLPGQTKGKTNLLIVFLRDAPLADPELASFFAEPQTAERAYTTLCQDLAKSLTGRESFATDRLEVLVLNKVNPGQVQVELSRSVSAEQVVEGGRAWEAAAENLPELVFRRRPLVPFPSEVLRATQQQWIRGGKQAADTIGCQAGQVYDMFVGRPEDAASAAAGLLNQMMKRTGPLLAAVAHAVHRGSKESWTGFAKGAQASASVAVAVLAASLKKIGRDKEDYMQGPAYQLGRFLSLADTLHREYCGAVRDKQIPPQLLGNALLPAVVANPEKGLAQMIHRLRVYRAWAEKSGTGLARWSVGEMGRIAPALAERLPQRLGDAEKAELMLGYLARAEKKQGEDERSDD